MMARPFHWFPPETVAELRDQLNDAGPGARLEIVQDGHDMTMHVIPAGDVSDEARSRFVPLNKSHVCPPDCP